MTMKNDPPIGDVYEMEGTDTTIIYDGDEQIVEVNSTTWGDGT